MMSSIPQRLWARAWCAAQILCLSYLTTAHIEARRLPGGLVSWLAKATGGESSSNPEEMSIPVSNLVGATIFILYVVLALAFTSMIVFSLYSTFDSLSRSKKKQLRSSIRIRMIVGLSIISFALLSFNMLSFLILSHEDWCLRWGPSGSRLSTIWQWTTTSTLFTQFAVAIAANPTPTDSGWPWLALTTTMWAMMYMSAEGVLSMYVN